MPTLGSLYLSLLLQVQAGGSATAESSSGSLIANLISRSTVPAKVVIVLLVLFSVISWGVILYKIWTLQRARRQTAQFLDVFRRSNKFSEVQAVCRSLSDSPLVGLFGTVWGILVAFEQIGVTGSTSIASVGPGISEALVTTALGLFAAIPAVIFYNHLTNRVKQFASEMDDFSMEFLNISERNFT